MERLNEIRHYVVNKYPDCCLAVNYGDSDWGEEDKALLAEELDNYFWLEHMNLCGCGSPIDCKKEIKKYLNVVNDWTNNLESEEKSENMFKAFGVTSVYGNPLLLFMAYSLDNNLFIEHGSGIGGAWITELGRMYLDVLNEVNFDEEL